MSKKISFLFCAGILFSCGSKSSNVDEGNILKFNYNQAILIDNSHFEIVEMIPLETNSQNLMGLDLRVRESKEGYAIMDIGSPDAIHQFELKGKYLGTGVTVGEGPGQLKGLQDFQLDKNGDLFFLLTLGDKTSIYKKPKGGELLKVLDADYIASSFSLLEDGGYLLAGGHNLPFVSNRVVKINSNGNVQESFLPNDYSNNMIPMSERNFFESREGIFYTEIFNNKVYKYSSGRFETALEIDFGKYSIPDEFWKRDLTEGFKILMENGFATYRSVFYDSNNFILRIHIQSESGFYSRVCLIDVENKKSFYWEGNTEEEDLFINPIGFIDGDVMFLTYQSVLEKKFENTTPNKLSNKIKKLDFDYPVFVRAKINLNPIK